MTKYVLNNWFGQSDSTLVTSVSILAGTFPVYVTGLSGTFGTGGAGPTGSLPAPTYRYDGTVSVTGGSTLTPTPIRDGAPAASAVLKLRPTISGTSHLLTTSLSTPPPDLVIAPGHALFVINTISSGTNLYQLIITFDELRLGYTY